MRLTYLLPTAMAAVAIGVAPAQRPEEAGVFPDRIVFGQSAAFTGPASDLGNDLRVGIQAAFEEVNRRGGVHGRKLELVSLDDGYEPALAIANTTKLIEEEKVFALIGAVGTPTSRSANPIALKAGVPYIAPFSGAAFLRDESRSNVINLRASYNQETEAIAARLVEDLRIRRIGVLYQDDSYGRAGYQGIQQALARRDIKPVAVGWYARNTTAVKTALLDLRSGDPDAVVLIGAYQPVAALVSWARHLRFNPLFVTISFVGSRALARELGRDGAGVYVTQVVPHPPGDQPVAAAYRRALKAHDSKAAPGFVSFEGYLAGWLAIIGLERSGSVPDRQSFLASLRTEETININGFQLNYGPEDNQGSDTVFLTMIDGDGSFLPIRRLAVPFIEQ